MLAKKIPPPPPPSRTCPMFTLKNKAFRERQQPSAPRSVNEQPIHWARGWKLPYEFHIDPLLGRSTCHAPWPKVNPIAHPTSYPTHIPFILSESTLPLLRYSNFNILPSKSKVKVMGEVKVWSHIVSLTFYRLTSFSFHVNQSSHSWDTSFSKFDLENPRSRSWVKSKFEVAMWV